MDPLVLMIIEIIITAIISWEAYKLHCLTKDGAVASLSVGVILAVFGSLSAFVLMTLFTVASFFATMKDIDRKIEMGLQEGQFGERRWKNVAAVAFPPCLITVVHFFVGFDDVTYAVAFISSVAVAGADTIASEIGVKDPRAYMITTMKPVEPGVNGGISVTGTVTSTIAALAIAFIGWITMTDGISIMLLIPFAMGVFGNFLDSVFGAMLENKGLISKYTNNWSTELISGILGGAIYYLIQI